MGRGRKKLNKYEEYVKGKEDAILDACRKGATNVDIAKLLGCGRTTLNYIIQDHDDFRKLLHEGKREADAFVENALFKRAIGYEYEETQTTVNVLKDGSGNTTQVKKVKKHVAADTTAAIFWLKNRNPEEWREKKEVSVSNPFMDLLLADCIDEEIDENSTLNEQIEKKKDEKVLKEVLKGTKIEEKHTDKPKKRIIAK